MKRHLRIAVFMVLTLTVVACAAPVTVDASDPSAHAVETIVAATFQALAPETAASATSVPNVPSSLLPQSLYFLANDSQGVSQIFRLERDGTTKTQLTFEPGKIWDYAVSYADGSLAFETNNQLILTKADGSNRLVVAEGTAHPEGRGFFHPVFSPDGKTLAYARGGLILYDTASGVSNLVITDQMNDIGDGHVLPVETYAPEGYSPDGTKLLLALGHWEVLPSHAVYVPSTNALIRYAEVTDYIYCCSFHGGPVWAPDGSSFYGIASVHDTIYRSGELWKINAANGEITRMFTMGEGTFYLPYEPYLAPDGQLYFFFGTYSVDSGFFDAPVLELVRAAPDDVTNRTVLRDENFVMVEEALWAPDASFVVVATSPGRVWDELDGGVLEMYYTDGQKDKIWLAPFGAQMKWGP